MKCGDLVSGLRTHDLYSNAQAPRPGLGVVNHRINIFVRMQNVCRDMNVPIRQCLRKRMLDLGDCSRNLGC